MCIELIVLVSNLHFCSQFYYTGPAQLALRDLKVSGKQVHIN